METVSEADEAWVYQIKVQGPLAQDWTTWFHGLSVTCETGEDSVQPVTTFTGVLADQAALRGVLTRLWNLNLTLISLTRLGKAPTP
jgi:hypothetical protein